MPAASPWTTTRSGVSFSQGTCLTRSAGALLHSLVTLCPVATHGLRYAAIVHAHALNDCIPQVIEEVANMQEREATPDRVLAHLHRALAPLGIGGGRASPH